MKMVWKVLKWTMLLYKILLLMSISLLFLLFATVLTSIMYALFLIKLPKKGDKKIPIIIHIFIIVALLFAWIKLFWSFH